MHAIQNISRGGLYRQIHILQELITTGYNNTITYTNTIVSRVNTINMNV